MASYLPLLLALISSCLLAATSTTTSPAYKILIVAPGLSNSQLIFNYRLADLLSARGHQVTVFVPQYSRAIDMKRRPKAPAKFLTREVSTKFDELKSAMDEQMFEDKNPMAALPMFLSWFVELKDACERQILDQDLMTRLGEEKFDVAIGHMYDLCPLGMFRALNISSYIWMSSGVLLDYMAWYGGAASPASYVPNALSSFGDRMTLVERMKNLFGVSFMHVIYRYMSANPYNELFHKHYGPEFPDIMDVAAKSPLIFVNSEELIDFPRPILHKIIYIGGIDTNKPAPLSDEWSSLLDKSEKGVILFSFGSVVNATAMPHAWKLAFLEAFSRFPDYTFVWKYDAELPEAKKVKNVKLTKWAPQKDMLGHPKLKAFISHCGFNSLMESITNGIPMLALPIVGDQMGNVKRAQRNGVVVALKKTDLTPDTIEQGLREVLTNQNYTMNARRLTNMIKKKPVKPEQLAVGWVEFLAEHKELPNLQPISAEMSFVEYFNLDVALILISGWSVFLFVLWIVARCLLRRCCKKGGDRSSAKSKSE